MEMEQEKKKVNLKIIIPVVVVVAIVSITIIAAAFVIIAVILVFNSNNYTYYEENKYIPTVDSVLSQAKPTKDGLGKVEGFYVYNIDKDFNKAKDAFAKYLSVLKNIDEIEITQAIIGDSANATICSLRYNSEIIGLLSLSKEQGIYAISIFFSNNAGN